MGVLYNNEGRIERAKALFTTCLQLDNNFSVARGALKKLEGLHQLSDWYSWWLKSEKGKKVLGLTLITSIAILFSITAVVSLAAPHLQLNITKFLFPTQANSSSGDKADLHVLLILIILLMIILFLPSLRSIKVGTIELATYPIDITTVEIKSTTPMPFKSEYMPLHFVMPLKSEIGLPT